MIFSAVKSPQGERDYAPWCVFVDGHEIINGIENEAEAQSICELLRTAKPKTLPPPKPKPPRFQPREISGWKLLSTRRLIREQPKERGQALLEFALCLPFILALLCGSLDLLLCLTANGDVHSLADSGAQCITRPSCGNAVQYVQGAAAGLSLNASQLTVTQNGNAVTVAYSYQPVSFVFPQVNLSATATAAP